MVLWSVTLSVLGAPVESFAFFCQIRIIVTAATWAIKKSSIYTCKVL